MSFGQVVVSEAKQKAEKRKRYSEHILSTGLKA